MASSSSLQDDLMSALQWATHHVQRGQHHVTFFVEIGHFCIQHSFAVPQQVVVAVVVVVVVAAAAAVAETFVE
jgi:hypothetical protein